MGPKGKNHESPDHIRNQSTETARTVTPSGQKTWATDQFLDLSAQAVL